MHTQNNSHWYRAQTNETLHSNYLPIKKKKESMINHNGKKYFKRNRYMGGGWGVGYLLTSVQLVVTPCTIANQASLSMEFSRQEY